MSSLRVNQARPSSTTSSPARSPRWIAVPGRSHRLCDDGGFFSRTICRGVFSGMSAPRCACAQIKAAGRDLPFRTDEALVIGIVGEAELQLAQQGQHGRIAAQDTAAQVSKAGPAGSLEHRLDEPRTDSAALPRIVDKD